MLSKNNQKLMAQKLTDQHQRFGLRKLSIGVVSFLLGTTFFIGSQTVHADTTNSSDNQAVTTEQVAPSQQAQTATTQAVVLGQKSSTNQAAAGQNQQTSTATTKTTNQTPASDQSTVGTHQLASTDFTATLTDSKVVNGANDSQAGYEEIDPQIALKHSVNAGDYIDIHLGLPYQNADGKTEYQAYDNVLSSAFDVSYEGTVIGTVQGMGNYYRLVFNDAANQFSNPTITLNLRWGSDGTRFSQHKELASLNDHYNHYVYQATDDPTKAGTSFTYVPTNDIDINGQKLTSGFGQNGKGTINGTYVNTKGQVAQGNVETSSTTGFPSMRTWNDQGQVSVNTNWWNVIEIAPSTNDLGNEFDLVVAVPQDSTGLVTFTPTSAAQLQQELEKDIAQYSKHTLTTPVDDGQGTTYLQEKDSEAVSPKVTVSVTGPQASTGTDGKITYTWHVKLTNDDPTDFPEIQLKGSVNLVTASAANFTMPADIKSYQEDLAAAKASQSGNFGAIVSYAAKTDNQALMKDLQNLPVALTHAVKYTNGQAATNYSVFGAPWTAEIVYVGDSSVDGGADVSDLVAAKLLFEDQKGHQLNNGVTVENATGSSITFAGGEALYQNLVNQGYEFVRAVSQTSNGTETTLTNFDPAQLDSHNFGTLSKNGPTTFIIYLRKAQEQNAQLNFVDDDNNGQSLAQTLTAKGMHDTAITFAGVQAQIDQLTKAGYVLVDTTADDQAQTKLTGTDWQTIFGHFDDDDDIIQGFTIHFVHQALVKTEAATAVRNIHYVENNQNGAALQDPTQQTVNFTGTYYVDATDKRAKPAKVNVKEITDANGQQQTVVDSANTATPTDTWQVAGTPTSFAQVDTPAFITNKAGKWNLTNEIAAETPTAPATSDAYLIYQLETPKPTTKTVEDSKTVTETIHYVYADGKQAHADYSANPITFKRTGVTNLTTNQTTWDPWTPASADFKAVTSPVIAGYTADQVEVGTKTVDPTSDNVEVTVTYTADQPVNPTQPTSQTQPTAPSSPTNPTTPTSPTSPTNPTNPTNPKPTSPTSPTNPTSPTEPSQPTAPTSPTQPTSQTEPLQPVQPTQPKGQSTDDHETPTTPDVPTQPTSPDITPTTPEQPQANNQGDNDQPSDQPVVTKVTSQAPTTVAQSNVQGNATNRLPQTGNDQGRLGALLGLGLLGALTSLVLGSRKKNY